MRTTLRVLVLAAFMAGCGAAGEPGDTHQGDESAAIDAVADDATGSDTGDDATRDAPIPDFNPFGLDLNEDTAVSTDELHADSGEQDANTADPGPDTAADADPDSAADSIVDTIQDNISADTGGDTSGDSRDDAVSDAHDDIVDDSDSGPDTLDCPEIDCDLTCENGYKSDTDGCPTCRCRECEIDSDCFRLDGFLCDKPTCGSSGDCVCDCQNFSDFNYVCPCGTTINMGRCSGAGVTYLDRVEQECPTLCSTDETIDVSCPDASEMAWCTCEGPSCRPVCAQTGTRSEGWYDGCTGELIVYAQCRGHVTFCDKIGTKSEGWYDTAGTFIRYDICAPSWKCPGIDQVCSSLECGFSRTPGDVTCPDGSTTAFCSCDSGSWTCFDNPFSVCTGRWRGCVKAGQPILDETYLQCCPGTVRLRPVMDDGSSCVPDIANPLGTCTVCGDAVCDAPEDRCNCPEDCLAGAFPGGTGSECLRQSECPPGLRCSATAGAPGTCEMP